MSETGIYQIRDPCAGDNTFNSAKIYTRCDMETDGGGWIVIQRRITNGTVNFYRNWEDYVNGFGDLDGEFWIGLNNIYQLTNQQEVELQLSVWNDSQTSITWNYQTFHISDSDDKYRLNISRGVTFGNDKRDFLFNLHNGRYFSTYDNDNPSNCGYSQQGGWWYGHCGRVNLNGRHQMSDHPVGQMLRWYLKVFTNSVMMIRSKTCGLS